MMEKVIIYKAKGNPKSTVCECVHLFAAALWRGASFLLQTGCLSASKQWTTASTCSTLLSTVYVTVRMYVSMQRRECLVPFCLSISCLTLSWIHHLGLLLILGVYTWSHFPFLILIIHHMWHFSPTSTEITPFICICGTTCVAKSKGKLLIIS